ncbi:MAG: adenylate/guanylate cyclase domain-containing protein [Alphaproteobacteria bacterium]|nr:adenylate/guanylate cyclase domain-containing protein [Alphaproteobacteria bacterium]
MTNRIRLASGLVLFAFVFSHLANHALGLISLEVMEEGRRLFNLVWRNWPGTILLYGSLAVHFTLGLLALYRRRTLRMSLGEAIQLLLGLAAIPLLAEHVLATRLLEEITKLRGNYTYVIYALWVLAPGKGAIQAVALTVVWAHGVMGLYYWLRLKPGVPRLFPLLSALAVLVPVLSLLGFVAAGREIEILAQQTGWATDVGARMHWPQAGAIALVDDLRKAVWGFLAGAVVAVFAAKAMRALWAVRRGTVAITYPGPNRVTVPQGLSVLEASRAKGIPHASVCGGRGRCSTCRVRIGEGLEGLDPPLPAERQVLDRVGAAPDTRLACQLRPTAPISVTPLLAPTAGIADAHAGDGSAEREIAIMFADVRGFTGLAEGRLPYDVVFILNRYFQAMGEAIEQAGGRRVDKFMGDGIMALFGVGSSPAEGSRAAVNAARTMARALDRLNQSLQDDIPAPIRIGIGIHVGPVILGNMGYGAARHFMAIGDAVNAASRLETLTKDYGCQLVLSEDVARAAKLDFGGWPRKAADIRGLKQPLPVLAVADAGALPDPL